MKQAEKNNGHLSERLPQRRPSRDLWPGIQNSLEAGGAASLDERLPLHKPVHNLWPAIARKIPAPWYSLQSNFLRSILAAFVAIVLMLLWLVPFGEDETTGPHISESSVAESTEKSDITNNISATERPENMQVMEKGKEVKKRPARHTASVIIPPESEVEQVVGSVIETAGSNASPATTINTKSDASIPETGYKSSPAASAPCLVGISFFDRAEAYSGYSKHPGFKAGESGYLNPVKDVSFEAGAFFQPTGIRNISTLNNDWYYSPGVGVSLGMVHQKLILETGLSLSRMEFEDKIEIDYFAYVFLGTVFVPRQYTEEFVNEQGDTISQIIYTVELVDIYDSTFVEDEKNDIVKLSTATIPMTVGYRFSDQGHYFLDVKTGLDMMIITGRVIPGNPVSAENIKVTDVRNSLAGKYSVKWKYHLSLGAGLRISERWALYAEPTLWWYPDGVRTGETLEMKNPFEAGLKVGLKWEF
jgi:hypothetical protein